MIKEYELKASYAQVFNQNIYVDRCAEPELRNWQPPPADDTIRVTSLLIEDLSRIG